MTFRASLNFGTKLVKLSNLELQRKKKIKIRLVISRGSVLSKVLLAVLTLLSAPSEKDGGQCQVLVRIPMMS